ncbi:hypothetical protein AAG906_039082 [Vitis piasezkii]
MSTPLRNRSSIMGSEADGLGVNKRTLGKTKSRMKSQTPLVSQQKEDATRSLSYQMQCAQG